MLIKNATIFTAVQPEPVQADISVENGTINAIAPGLSLAPGEEVVDVAGLRVYPGFVDAHSHIGGLASEREEWQTYARGVEAVLSYAPAVG